MSFRRIIGFTAKWLLTGIVITALASCAGMQHQHAADGNARFEFLTPSLVRMEYSPTGVFVDAPTAVVQKRDWIKVPVQSSQKDGWLIISSSEVTLRYRLKSGPFTADNLKVSWKRPSGGAHDWYPGAVDTQNMGGLTYSLDNISKPNLAGGEDLESPVNDVIPGIEVLLPKAKPGLVSRSGYAFIDDSKTPLWNAQRRWIEPRAQTAGQDWYLFTYDRDYQKVFQEYAQLCGAIPMVPRYVLGAWITDFNFEYFPGSAEAAQSDFKRYNQQHLQQEVSRLRRSHIPFDTLVLDFAWHNFGWDGGYDWSPLIPHPQKLMDWLHAQGIKLSLNDHPGYANTDESILSFDDTHATQALQALGRPLPQKPSFDMDVSKHWEFAIDPHDRGVDQQWFAQRHGAPHWKPIKLGTPWESQGYKNYAGVAWYRTSVRLPERLPAALYLYVGEVSKSYRVFVNGKEATHSVVRWPARLTYTDIAPYAKPGQGNEIVLRVESGKDGSGVNGPVALKDVEPLKRIYFDLSNQQQADVFMRDLHGPLMRDGVDMWWVDGGSGAVDMPGLDKQLWTNKVFYDFRADTNQSPENTPRGFILGRYGDWGSERYPGYFTGDTYSEWPVLAYEVAYTARGGNVLVPYMSHDIGGFHGAKIDFDLYARWIEFGTFSPILRMHSAHANPQEGNVRMPWVYGDKGMALMKKYFTLRTQLIPYVYTYTWLAHRDSMPILRPLYLQYPDLDEAYQHSHEYFFGEQMLVAPVLDTSGNNTIYLPPGEWIDFFNGKRYAGGTTFTEHYAVDQTPVFVRDGAIIPEQDVSDYSNQKPLDNVIVNVYGTDKGHFDLYEDDGSTMAYSQNQYAVTSMDYVTRVDGQHQLVIDSAKGSFNGQVQTRSYELRIHTTRKPASIAIDGGDGAHWKWKANDAVAHWKWDAKDAVATVVVPKQSIRDRVSVTW